MVFHRRRSINLCEAADDSSVTSTISVNNCDSANKTAPPLHTTVTTVTTTTPKKSVRFDFDANEEHDHPLYKDECVDAWYKASEYKYFKHSAMCAARALAQTEAKNRAPFSYQRVMEQTYKTCKDVMDEETESYSTLATPQERRHLLRWAEVAPNRLGLEKWALRKIVKEKQQRRFELIDFILDIQDVRVKNCTEDDRAEFIRKNCERISRPGRMFARALAQANAAAASSSLQQECNNDGAFFQ